MSVESGQQQCQYIDPAKRLQCQNPAYATVFVTVKEPEHKLQEVHLCRLHYSFRIAQEADLKQNAKVLNEENANDFKNVNETTK